MSGIYIKGMEMPKSCSDCFAEQRIGSDFGCGIIGFEDGNTTCFTRERRKDCPLIPAPDHGRLVDADALRNKLYEEDAITMRGLSILNRFPTIISADKGGAD